MRCLLILLCLTYATTLFSQNDGLAKNYFEQGEYEKALTIFKRLVDKNPGRSDYAMYLMKTYQQLEQFELAEAVIQQRVSGARPQPRFFIELGYNYALQEKDSLAQLQYQKAIDFVAQEEIHAYVIGKVFSEYSLLDEAVTVYESAMQRNPDRDFNAQLARIYGEQGKLKEMFEKHVDLIQTNLAYRSIAQRNFSKYVTEDPTNEANIILRKVLLKRLQSNPEILYNELLSWLFIQQKDFKKAFIQEKAIYKRTDQDIRGMVDLLRIAIDEGSYKPAEEIVDFVIENAPTPEAKLSGFQYLMTIKLQLATPKEYANIKEQYETLFNSYGVGRETLLLQLDYNKFLAFTYGEKELAISNLRKLSKSKLTAYEAARVKLMLADILVIDEKFNEALIYYSQVQNKVKSNILAQEARFKVARTSYYKGDFDWAVIQLDVLKQSASQLIANDAMELFLIIHDNSQEDSTKTALKKYARADLLVLQHKNTEAITLLDNILTQHKGEKIEDEALLKQGQVYEVLGEFEKAAENYSKLIEFYSEDILADDAHYLLAQLYEGPLANAQKAKELYEQIIYNFADSIYFVDARKRFRMLRGDEIN